MHDAARGLNNNLPQRVDGLIDSHCGEEEFLRRLAELCAGARDSAWTVLARIDQNYRRGKLSPERFRLARLSIERRMLGFNDARAASVATRPRESEAPPPPAIEALAVMEAPRPAKLAPTPVPAVRFVPAPAPRPMNPELSGAIPADTSRRWRVSVIVTVFAALAAALIAQMQRASQPASSAPVAAPVIAAAASAVAEAEPLAPPLPAAHIGFDGDRAVVPPGQTVAEVTVVRTGDSSAEVRIPWWTESAGARAGEDFAGRGRRTLVLAAGEERGSLQVPILRNPQRRHIQMFYVRLGKPEGAELDTPSFVPVFIVPR